jgi:hypothetical protein
MAEHCYLGNSVHPNTELFAYTGRIYLLEIDCLKLKVLDIFSTGNTQIIEV